MKCASGPICSGAAAGSLPERLERELEGSDAPRSFLLTFGGGPVKDFYRKHSYRSSQNTVALVADRSPG